MDIETDGQQVHVVHVKEEWEEGTDAQQKHKVEWEETDGHLEHYMLIEAEPAWTGGLKLSLRGEVKEESALLDLYAGHKVEGDLMLTPETLQKPDSTFIQPTCESSSAPPERAAAAGRQHQGRGAPHASCEQAHTDFKPYPCHVCTKQFNRKYGLDRHLESHAKAKTHSCDMCTQQFSTKSKLTEHKRTHRGEKRFTCDLCEKQFALKQSLAGHLLSHNREKPYACGRCKKKFKCKHNLVAHEQYHIRKTPYACDGCTKRFTCQENLVLHKFSHDESYKKYFRKTSRSLAQHIQIQNENKPYSCEACPERFTCEENLNRHKLNHAAPSGKDSRQKPHRSLILYI